MIFLRFSTLKNLLKTTKALISRAFHCIKTLVIICLKWASLIQFNFSFFVMVRGGAFFCRGCIFKSGYHNCLITIILIQFSVNGLMLNCLINAKKYRVSDKRFEHLKATSMIQLLISTIALSIFFNLLYIYSIPCWPSFSWFLFLVDIYRLPNVSNPA